MIRLLRRGRGKEKKAGPWDLWKSLPRVRPFLQPYRRYLYAVVGLTLATVILGLAEPWPLAVILNQVLTDEHPTGLTKALFGEDPTTSILSERGLT